MWKLILEALKIIHYKDSAVKFESIYEQTLKLSYIDLHAKYSTKKFNRLSFMYLETKV